MIFKTFSAPATGPIATVVTLQFRVDRGLQAHISGLPAHTARDLLIKLNQCFLEHKLPWPRASMTWHLMPSLSWDAHSGLDLAMALCLLAAGQNIQARRIQQVGSLGLVGLDGQIFAHPHWTRWTLPDDNIKEWLIPAKWSPELMDIPDSVTLYPVHNLNEAIQHLSGKRTIRPTQLTRDRGCKPMDDLAPVDMKSLDGEWPARLAMCLAIIGHHPLILMGGPGTGKSMCARILHGLLPKLSLAQGQIVRRRHTARGLAHEALLVPPFRAPHPASSLAGMMGQCPENRGASGLPIPGEVTLAHDGVLCLDEFTEFSRPVIEGLRTVLDQGQVALARSRGVVKLPAAPLLIFTTNPCPCGHRFGHRGNRCRCTPAEFRKYIQKIRGPVLDRLALHIETGLPRVEPETAVMKSLKSSASARERIRKAMAMKHKHHRQQRQHMHPEALSMLEKSSRSFGWSLRAKASLAQVAASHMWWRLAAQPGQQVIQKEDMETAINFRIFDRNTWMEEQSGFPSPGKHVKDITQADRS